MNRSLPRKQYGVSMAVVLWFVAAMAILVATMVSHARMDVKRVQLHQSQVQAEAIAHGATILQLNHLHDSYTRGSYRGRGVLHQQQQVADHRVEVILVPTSGLIDLNRAREPLLQAMFQYGLGLDAGQAYQLAQRLLVWREGEQERALQPASASTQQRANPRFEVAEDLMLIDGIKRSQFEQLRHLIHTTQDGDSGVDWLSAPSEVLAILLRGDKQSAEAVASARRSEFAQAGYVTEPALPSGLSQQHLSNYAANTYRIDVLVSPQENSQHRFLQRTWVQYSDQPDQRLPWKILRTEGLMVDRKSDSSSG